MIQLTFNVGGGLRKIIIKGRKVSILSAETGFTPFTMDLDKLTPEVMAKAGDFATLINEASKLKNEKAMQKDIIKDFNEKGWRLVRKS